MLISLAQSLFRRLSALFSVFLMGRGGAGGEEGAAIRAGEALVVGVAPLHEDGSWSPELIDPLPLPGGSLQSRESRCEVRCSETD